MGTEAQARGREATALVAAARTGDPAAFDLLVRRYRARVYALALHLTGEASDADDITQDVFVQAFGRIRDFEGRSDFFTWLYRITLNRALNVKRAQGRRAQLASEDARVSLAVDVDAEGNPRRALELRESYALLVSALDRLTPSLRTTVVLVCLQGLSHSEAAVVLGTSEGTIAWRVHEARGRLRASLQELGKPASSARRARASLRTCLDRWNAPHWLEEPI